MNFELINGSWQQTLATILYDIDQKLNDTEISDIIKRIDDRISDEDILELLGIILNKLTSLQTDNIDVKSDIISLSNIISTILINTISLRTDISKISNRVNSLSIVNKVVVVEKPIEKIRIKRERPCKIYNNIEIKENITFLIDMELIQGHSEPYKIYIPGGYTYDSRLSWLISGSKRRLLYLGDLTDDLLEIYKSYNILDVEIIKKSRINTYDNSRFEQRT